MKSGALPEDVRKMLQFLADNKVLSKNKPNRFRYEIDNNFVNIVYDTNKYKCLFLQLRPTQSLTPIPPDSFTTHFGVFTQLYTPFLYPILNPNSDEKYDMFAIIPEYSYGAEFIVLDEIFTKARYLLSKGNLSETLLPQFLALTSSRIAKKHNNDYQSVGRLAIEGKVNFTTVQIIKYLQQTSNVEEIISMWELGVLPEQYKSYIEDYSDAPEEWVKVVFEGNIKKHWEPKNN